MSNKIVVAGLIVSLFSFCSKPSEHGKSAEAENSEVAGSYGSPLSDHATYSLSQMHQTIQEEGSFEGKVVGTIKEVCAHKGCWMTVELPDGSDMRVTFKDYGFFVPKNSQGYPVVLEGIAQKSITDVAMLKHYAEDGGKSQAEIDAITDPEESVAFEATGVVIEEGA